jgi:glyoxylase-like metal-dependent hydrolase (beta-lactamase superfamily II)|nr:MBL fold metallo-hydrolase [Candidatus Acidoferrales bacterium]
MRLGDIEVHLIGDGTFRLDGGAMFGVIPRPLWEKKSPPDDRNRILLAMSVLLIHAGGKLILVETGGGDKWNAKQNSIYLFESSGRLPERLAKLGVKPEEIDIVINTHLHFDHCGWNTRLVNGVAAPTFPNARYIVQRKEFDHACAPTERDRASYFPDNFMPIQKSGQWDFLNGDSQIVPGIEVVVVPGHIKDMQCVKISAGGQTIFFVADLVPTAAHLSYPWIMGYDLYPMTTLENKHKWLPIVAKENWTIIFGHEPHIPAAKLRERDGGFDAEPVLID